MLDKLHGIGVLLVKRFILGWYGVELRLSKIEAVLEEIEGVLKEMCHDCPTRRK